MRSLLLLLALLIPSLSQADADCIKNPVFCNIVKLQPRINRTFALDLSNSLVKYAKMFGTNPLLSVAIAMQESSLENRNRMGRVLRAGRLVRGITDVGVFQIHVDTIAALRDEGLPLDVARLETDVDYQAYWHTLILSRKIRTCRAQRVKLEVSQGEEWSCYHSFTLERREVYVKDVGVHLAKIAAR